MSEVLTAFISQKGNFVSADLPDTSHLRRIDEKFKHIFPPLIDPLALQYQALYLAHERTRVLQAIIRPLLSQTTWNEAIEVVRRGRPALPTELHQATILRLDIADFTQLLNRYPLNQVLLHLNEYLNLHTRLVYDHHGDVDKYLGDGFLAVFKNADDAVQAGCAIQKVAADFNQCESARSGIVFLTRIGIDSGQVVLTSLGSADRQDRTVMGMPVNLAERLQAQATPGRVWLSQATFDQLRDPSGCHCLGPVQVKGRPEPVIVYEK